ncbi:MAG: TolC family protein [Deltaproteobacteria bacterium]|nr:TolC family protein [Deltaproteobacteria bacterium]
MLSVRNTGWLLSSIVFLNGCASVALNAGFDEVKATVEERAAIKIYWNNGTDLDREAAEKLGLLLKDKLTVDDAVQIGLLNNRELQAVYSDLGVAQADLVQAGLLNNPIFDGAMKWATPGGGKPDLELAVVMNFLDIFYLPLRKRVAAARVEETKTRVSGMVLDFASRVRTAFLMHQANQQMLELRQTIVQALTASFEVTRRLQEAGNITDLEFARERALLETGKLALRSVEVAVRQSREELNTLMGLWGKNTEWQTEERLPEMPQQPIQTEELERVVLNRSVDLLSARQRLVSAGEQLGLNKATALIPESHIGALGERTDGAWEVGPVLEFPIPLFDQGQARTGRAAAELRRAQQEYYALAIRIRSMSRAVRDRMEGARDRALYYRDIMLPLHSRIVNEAQLHYNAMQLGPIQLLRAREQQIETGAAYVEALRDYWLARAELAQLLSGRLPGGEGARAGDAAAMRGARTQGRNPEGH